MAQMTDTEFEQFKNDYQTGKPEAVEKVKDNGLGVTMASLALSETIAKVTALDPNLAVELNERAEAYREAQYKEYQAEQDKDSQAEGYKTLDEIAEIHDPEERLKLIRQYHTGDKQAVKEHSEKEKYGKMSLQEIQENIKDPMERIKLIQKYHAGGDE